MSDLMQYFAAKEAKDTVQVLLDKAQTWQSFIKSNGLKQKMQDMWRAYHGAYYASMGNGHEITFSGEQGELSNLAVNHFRNIAQHILVMTTSSRPSLQARATNTDYKSLVQTKLANEILDYYMREKKLEKFLKNAVEYAIVFGAGYVKMEWNATAGEIYDTITNEDGSTTPLHDGDIEFSNLSPFDVIVDSTKEHDDHDWVLVRGYKNKYDLAAKYPEFEDKIKGLQTKSDLEKLKFGINNINETTDDVPVFEFYHRKSDAMPDGRFIMFLSEEIVLQDRAIPYRVLPIFKITPGNILGSPYGYSPLFDILPLQEAVNSLYSTVLTNQSTFGVQNVWMKRGSDINVSTLAGGLNIIESLERPEPINLTNTPKEIFDFIGMLEGVMETISGVNSVARGDPQSSLKSGAALALVQSMALQFTSGLQQSYVQLIEDVGTALVKMLQDFAKSPRLIAVVGNSNRSQMKEFESDKISNISRVIVDVGNPMARTVAGRMEMANNLLQYAQDQLSPHQYLNVMNTGKLEVMTEDLENELLLIKGENEELMNGGEIHAIITDNHKSHIMGHKGVLADPVLRRDMELVRRATMHIQEHIDLLKTGNPDLLMLLNQQPLQPPMPPAPPQGGPQGAPEEMMQPPPQGFEGLQQQGAEITGPGLEQSQNLPSMPQVPAEVLPNPQLQADQMGNVQQG